MNLFDMFDMLGDDVPTVEEKKVAKTDDANKSVNKGKTAKNSINLPANAYILMHGKVELTQELLGVEEPVVSNDVIESYLRKNYKICNALDFSYDNNNIIATTTLTNSSQPIEIEEGDTALFAGMEYSLSDAVGEIQQTDLLNLLNEAGASFPESTSFVKKGNVILPRLPLATDKETKEGLLSPVTINFYGFEDITFESSESITVDSLRKEVEKRYPALKSRIAIVNLNKTDNTVGAIISNTISSGNTGGKETTYKITENTTIKFFSNELPKIKPGEYTHKDLCKALAKAGVVECNTPDSIMLKEIKGKDLIVLGLKFGGSKG